MTKLEEVAEAVRAACVAHNIEVAAPLIEGGPFLIIARAALNGLRPANEKMLAAGESQVDDGETYSCAAKAEGAFYAMIDSILSERAHDEA
jgi:hypothetical protein